MFLRPDEAAELAGLSERAIYRAIQRGDLHAVRLCSRLRIRREDFDEWVARVGGPRRAASGRGRAAPAGDARQVPPALRRGRRRGDVMSVERVERKDGSVVWRVRWRHAGRNRSKVLGRKRDADAFDAEITRRKRTGDLAQLDAGKELLSDFGDEWWRLYAEPNLARSTLNSLRHALGRARAAAAGFDPAARADRGRRSTASASSSRPTASGRRRSARRSCCSRACCSARASGGASRRIRLRSCASRCRLGRARSSCRSRPRRVELIRDALLRAGRPRDADARLGPRLRRACDRARRSALPWEHVRSRTMLIDRAVSLGRIETTKTGRRRTVMLLGPLAQDLAEWRLHAGRPDEGARVPVAPRGRPGHRTTGELAQPDLHAGGQGGGHREAHGPYDLRHSFVSLLIAEGHNVVEVARQAGHSPNMALDTYAHVFEEFDPGERDQRRRPHSNGARRAARSRAQQPTLFDVA